MNRLQTELDRLYGPGAPAVGDPATGSDARRQPGGLRAAVLAVVLPLGWEQLAPVWYGVQADLELPAPAIAVSGRDALQLWFSFAPPIAAAAGARFLEALRERYLPGVAPSLVRACAETAGLPPAPAVEIESQRWSAFVSHDLASVFGEAPWLDIPPTDDGQATLLRALEPIGPVAFASALARLGAVARLEPPLPQRDGATAADRAGPRETDPERFLTGVMNDETAPLALRIEAARILLGGAGRTGAG